MMATTLTFYKMQCFRPLLLTIVEFRRGKEKYIHFFNAAQSTEAFVKNLFSCFLDSSSIFSAKGRAVFDGQVSKHL